MRDAISDCGVIKMSDKIALQPTALQDLQLRLLEKRYVRESCLKMLNIVGGM